ncbi:alpha/beta hydrolase [Streptomyces sp. NPDC020875]|uniref:alpha/beta hydrolase n=1 Tax=Streptomyces sp. NPDC020875 TaxID=3154898 RepID=UPI0033F53F07
MDLKTLRALKPAAFEGAADGYRALADMAQSAKDQIESGVIAGMRKAGLKGEALDAALGEIRELGKNFQYTQVECGVISTALHGFAFDLAAAKQKLDAALADAEARKFSVNDDGTVTYPAGPDKVDGKIPEAGSVRGPEVDHPVSYGIGRQAAYIDPNPYAGPAYDIAVQISRALAEATAADGKWAPKLRALKADDDLTVSARDWTDTTADTGGVREAAGTYLATIEGAPKDASPARNAEWWRGLTDEERNALISMNPAGIGALDGLPSDVRDEANRTVLAQKQGEYRLSLSQIPPAPENKYTWINGGRLPVKVRTDEYQDWYKKYGEDHERLTKALKGMDRIGERFDDTGTQGLPQAYLLGFSAEGDGRAIIANGNPDTADHTAVYVPGTGASLEKAGGDISRMTTLWEAANTAAKGQSVATITWIGYDAPDHPVKDAPFSHYANDAAPALNRFLDGVESSRTAEGPGHTTVIGHSYGSTVIGSAARQGDLNADDVVVAGSPGMQVGKAEELDVPKGRVWNQEAPGDIVPDIGGFSHGGVQIIGNHVASGIVPSDGLFGANQMTTDTKDHSNYWKAGTQSLQNQAEVVVGNYGNVKLED